MDGMFFADAFDAEVVDDEDNTVDEILPMWAWVDQIGSPHRENAKIPPHWGVHIGRPPMGTTTGARCGVSFGR
jgi:hypothetical protein